MLNSHKMRTICFKVGGGVGKGSAKRITCTAHSEKSREDRSGRPPAAPLGGKERFESGSTAAEDQAGRFVCVWAT